MRPRPLGGRAFFAFFFFCLHGHKMRRQCFDGAPPSLLKFFVFTSGMCARARAQKSGECKTFSPHNLNPFVVLCLSGPSALSLSLSLALNLNSQLN